MPDIIFHLIMIVYLANGEALPMPAHDEELTPYVTASACEEAAMDLTHFFLSLEGVRKVEWRCVEVEN